MNILNVHPQILIAFQPFMPLFKMVFEKYQTTTIPQQRFNGPLGLFHFYSGHERQKFRKELPLVTFNSQDTANVIQQMQKILTTQDSLNNKMKPLKMIDFLKKIQPGTFIDLISQFLILFEKAYNQTNIPILGFKELYCEEFIDPFINVDNKTILLIRDPRAVLSSRNYGKYPEATGGTYPILYICMNWRRSVQQYAANRHNANLLMVRYEDLISTPEQCLKTICRFLNLPFDPNMLNYSLLKDSSGNPWKGNSSFSTGNEIDIEAINRWQTKLSTAEIKIVEYFCRPEMDYMDYHRQYPTCESQDIEVYHENRGAIKQWISELGFTLTETELQQEQKRQDMLTRPQNGHTDTELYASFNGPLVFSQFSKCLKNKKTFQQTSLPQ